jgi:predicted helicase
MIYNLSIVLFLQLIMSRRLINQYYQDLETKIRYSGSKNEGVIRSAFSGLLNNYCKSRNFELIEEFIIPTKLNTKIRVDGVIKDALRLDWGYWESKDEKDNLEEEIEVKFKKGYPTDNILFEDTNTAILIQKGIESLRVNMKNPDDLDKLINQFLDYERVEVKDFRQAINAFSQDLPTILNTLRNLIDSQSGNRPPSPNSGGEERGLKVPNVGDLGASEEVLSPPPSNSGNCPPTPNSGGVIEGLKVPNVGDLGANLGAINQKFIEARDKFLKVCQESINSEINISDIREMIIQHILTEDIFNNIFSEGQFHQENNIACQLQEVIKTFFTGSIKRNTLKTIESYYSVIIRTASSINNHQEKQKFLKVVYENFYKAYNPLAADRLGIVYTPNEIVKFMVESTDYLLDKHYNKLLGDKGVEILDPATGTGTFITEILEYLLIKDIEYKYQNEIHCNEVSILPYYIANLNIEYSYQQKTGQYLEFNNICLVDTLDHTDKGEKQTDLFSMTQENTERIKRQNDRKISVIIGNPPYNANQKNENDNNKNREYLEIDKRIKETYVKESTAQKTKVYDMYSRFYRWASDRLNDEGIIAFITNSSFIDARTFDGFRKVVSEDFDFIYVIDLGGDVRKNPQLSGTIHNVFGIQTGVAIIFLVKKRKAENKSLGKIFYTRRNELEIAKDKLNFLSATTLEQINFDSINPDKNNNWINLTDNDFNTFLPLVNKETKLAKTSAKEKAIFKLFSLGVSTNRDEWVYDFDNNSLVNKINFFFNFYKQEQKRWSLSDKQIKINDFVNRDIKWTSELENYLNKNSLLEFDLNLIIKSIYRPYIIKNLYFDGIIIHRIYQQDYILPIKKHETNNIIAFSGIGSNKSFQCLASNLLMGLDTLEKTQCLPLYRYEKGEKIENITAWGLEKFREYYCRGLTPLNPTSPENQNITKEDIFYYIYGVLHNPKYREKYEQNLKREFPRIPFYDNFWQWVNWGKKLMDLHINYENVKPYNLKITDLPSPLTLLPNGEGKIKVKLKADKINGKIIIDEVTTLENIPTIAWEYKLGNRSALEWILDQYKEKKPKDKIIAEKFNNYKFADYKETVIDLLMRVTTVSVETMNIVKEMNSLES